MSDTDINGLVERLHDDCDCSNGTLPTYPLRMRCLSCNARDALERLAVERDEARLDNAAAIQELEDYVEKYIALRAWAERALALLDDHWASENTYDALLADYAILISQSGRSSEEGQDE